MAGEHAQVLQADEMVLQVFKRCTKCGVPKQLDEFYRDERTSDKRRSECRKCCSRASYRSRRNNIERYRAWARQYGKRPHVLEQRRDHHNLKQANARKARERAAWNDGAKPVGDWMKVEKVTPDKPEIAILARKLGVSIGDAFLEWFRVYAWADGMTCPGCVPNLSLSDVDKLARATPRTAMHLASPEIGWLREDGAGVHFTKWERHNGKSAKARALDAEKKRKYRVESDDSPPTMSPECPAPKGTETGLEQEESKRESLLLKSNGKAIGNASRLPSRLPKDADDPIDVSGIDWSQAIAAAERVGRKVPPATPTDRRNWLRFGVMIQLCFSEHWLTDAVEAVVRAKATKKTKQAHLYGVLKAKAIEDGLGDTFSAMLRGIEIPDDVWKTSVLEVRK